MNVIKRILYNKTIRNGGLFSLFSFFQKGMSFLLLIILANYITPEAYGFLSLFNTVVMFLGYFVGLNTAGYLSVSFFSQREKNEFKKDFTTIFLIIWISSFVIALILISFLSPISEVLSMTPLLLIVALLLAIFRVFTQMQLDYLRVREKVTAYGIYCCSNALLVALLSFSLVLAFNRGWYGCVEGQFIALGFFTTISLSCFYKWNLFDFKELSISKFKEILFWGIPLIPHLAAIWLRQGGDRYIIEYNHSMADVGFFSFALNLTNVIVMIGSSFNNSFSVNIFQTLSSGASNSQKQIKLHHQNRQIILIYLIATVIILAMVSLLVPILLPEYMPSVKYFMILSFYGLCQCFYFQYCNYLFYYRKTKNLMYITFGMSLIHLLLSLTLTPYSLLLTCCIYVIVQLLVLWLVRRKGLILIRENLTLK